MRSDAQNKDGVEQQCDLLDLSTFEMRGLGFAGCVGVLICSWLVLLTRGDLTPCEDLLMAQYPLWNLFLMELESGTDTSIIRVRYSRSLETKNRDQNLLA